MYIRIRDKYYNVDKGIVPVETELTENQKKKIKLFDTVKEYDSLKDYMNSLFGFDHNSAYCNTDSIHPVGGCIMPTVDLIFGDDTDV